MTVQPLFMCQWGECFEKLDQEQLYFDHVNRHASHARKCLWRKCGKTVLDLNVHIRSHTQERPYFCGVGNCVQKFTTSGNAVRHRKSCRGEKLLENLQGVQKEKITNRSQRLRRQISIMYSRILLDTFVGADQRILFLEKCRGLAMRLEGIEFE